MNEPHKPRKPLKMTKSNKPATPGKPAIQNQPTNQGQRLKQERPTQPKSSGAKETGTFLTKQEKELPEECLDELYDDYGTYRKSLKPGEEMNLTYQMFVSIVKKLGLRQPK